MVPKLQLYHQGFAKHECVSQVTLHADPQNVNNESYVDVQKCPLLTLRNPFLGNSSKHHNLPSMCNTKIYAYIYLRCNAFLKVDSYA
jgi:hypothetical protein